MYKFCFPPLSRYFDPRAKVTEKNQKIQYLKFINFVCCLNSRIEMKKETVSEFKDKSMNIIQSKEQKE